ncbi:response regulator transcription factor [Actinomyces sp. zg-332]|uniref:response regulator transcription factor n=1 Tax=Actinomyces sp. zg-332 TaxID=2708340 RepID=UPI00141E5231|nr:response regulator transcription factor [Actinomyces sp. zg-332]QPK94065.1 response regulator transcription factor [Actinomyces sp. zg-332]
MKVMIVEDEENIALSVQSGLQRYGYETFVVKDFDTIIESYEIEKPNLILLDLFLPIHNGYHWCQEIRKISNVPIIFLSSRSENMDIVMGMQFGADDYITKPFDMSVLLAKVQAVLRRTYDFSNELANLTFETLNFDIKNMVLAYADKKVDLTKTEAQIMLGLFKEKGAFVSREKLIELCWKSDDFISDSTLAVNINRIRKKIENLGTCVYIETKKGYGYALHKLSDNHCENAGK